MSLAATLYSTRTIGTSVSPEFNEDALCNNWSLVAPTRRSHTSTVLRTRTGKQGSRDCVLGR
jgi:hypothetical protein